MSTKVRKNRKKSVDPRRDSRRSHTRGLARYSERAGDYEISGTSKVRAKVFSKVFQNEKFQIKLPTHCSIKRTFSKQKKTIKYSDRGAKRASDQITETKLLKLLLYNELETTYNVISS